MFKLPPEPVDGYELHWFQLVGDYDHDLLRIEERRAVYHVDSPWSVVFPDMDPRGVAFKDQWQMFRCGVFTGRNEGWASWPASMTFDGNYTTRAEAVAEMKRRLRERLKWVEMQRTAIIEKLKTLEVDACT